MSRVLCPRLWQVEAARDGRLAGSDLSNALRHRAQCADCDRAARALSELGRQIKALPVQPAEPLRRRRNRQTLLGAWNEHVLAEPRRRLRPRVLPIAAFCAFSGVALGITYPLLRGASPSSGSSAVARIQTHSGFEPKPIDSSRADPSSQPIDLLQTSATASVVAKPSSSSPLARSRIARPQRERATAQSATDSAEDEAYLQIVELLRSGRESEARARASQYLLQFPLGFRRREVENITKR